MQVLGSRKPTASASEWHWTRPTSHRVALAYHLPYVVQFLYDNSRNGISIVPPMPCSHSLIQVVGITNSGAYLEAASNVIPFASPARSVFISAKAIPMIEYE